MCISQEFLEVRAGDRDKVRGKEELKLAGDYSHSS